MLRDISISVGLGTLAAFTFIVSVFFFGVYVSEPVWYWASLPGAKLKVFLDSVLSPSAAGVLLGSQRQGVQHLFMGLCILLVWTAIFSVGILGVRHAKKK